MPYHAIVAAVSGRDDEDRVIHEAVRLTRAVGATLTVVHVQDPHAGKPSMMMQAEPLITEADLRDDFRRLGYDAEAASARVSIVVGASYPREIAAASKGADLLVVGHRRKNRFLAALSDSTDQLVSDLVSCPVLLVSL